MLHHGEEALGAVLERHLDALVLDIVLAGREGLSNQPGDSVTLALWGAHEYYLSLAGGQRRRCAGARAPSLARRAGAGWSPDR